MAANHDRQREEEALHAYYDGELGPWARWRMQRRLERSPELRRELVELEAMSMLVRESAPEVAVPELWSGIARGLTVADAERRVAAEASGARAGVLEWLFRPAAALVAAGAAAAALAMLLLSSETDPGGGVVHWVDGGTRNVMVLDGQNDVTVIWVFDPVGDGASRGGRRGAA